MTDAAFLEQWLRRLSEPAGSLVCVQPIAFCEELASIADFARAELAPLELARLLRLRSPKRAAEYVAGRIAAKRLLRSRPYEFGRAECVISTSPEGAPLIEGHPELHVSISHSGCFAVAAIASHRIGVDLEENVPRPPSLVRYFFEPREQVLLARRGARAQTSLVNELWCRKEAACKVGHWGGSLPFREVDGTRPHVTIAGRAIGLRSGATDQFAAAIAWESSPSALPADPRIQIPSGAREVRRG